MKQHRVHPDRDLLDLRPQADGFIAVVPYTEIRKYDLFFLESWHSKGKGAEEVKGMVQFVDYEESVNGYVAEVWVATNERKRLGDYLTATLAAKGALTV